MAYNPLNDTELEVGRPLKKEILDKIQDNFEDHETRITNNSISTGKFVIFSGVIDIETSRVGEIKHFLISSSTTVNELNGPDWNTRIDGSSMSGTDLASVYTFSSNLPNFKSSSRFLRYADISGYIGTEQASANKSHTHPIIGDYSFTSNNSSEISAIDNYGGTRTLAITTQSQGEFEARPNSCAVRMGVRVNDRPLNFIQVAQAPANLTIVNCTISSLEAGTSGNLYVDVKKGPDLGSMASILNTAMSLNYSAGSYATSSQASFSTSSLSQNDFISLDILSLQAGQTRFVVSCYAE